MIVGYLNSEGYSNTTLTLQDEANVKFASGRQRQTEFKAIKKLILGLAFSFLFLFLFFLTPFFSSRRWSLGRSGKVNHEAGAQEPQVVSLCGVQAAVSGAY